MLIPPGSMSILDGSPTAARSTAPQALDWRWPRLLRMPDRHAENPPPRALGQLKQLMRELLPRQSRKSWIKVGPRLAPIRQGRGVGFDPDSYLSQPGNGSNYPCTCGLCAGFLRCGGGPLTTFTSNSTGNFFGGSQ